jgi:SWIM zinc finger
MQPQRSNREHFAEVLHREVGLLQVQFPALADALSRAYAIVAGGRLFPEEDGRTATVLASDGVGSYIVNGHCTCPASTYRSGEPCKHRLAFRLYQRIADAMLEEDERWIPDDATPAFQPPAPTPTLPAEAVLMIQGKPFVKFEGLLQLAHARGLVVLETTVVSVSLDQAVCQATARFQDGRVFTDIGDASPENVAKHLRPHFIRMAATRASARALRRALNVGHCAVEELAGDEVGP